MKRLCFIILCGLILYSCSKDETVTNYLESNKGNTSNYRTLAEALQIAQDAASMVNDSVETRAASRTRIVDTKNVRVITSPGTRSFSANNDTLLYVLNYEDEKGFAVVSANKATEGLLAVTEDGSYEESSDAYHDTGISNFMELAKSYATRGPEDSLEVDFFIPIDTIYTTKGPLISVKWGQRYPEGKYCPNLRSGCAVTAAAQIFSYYKHPTSIALTYPNADINNQVLDWDEMRKHILYYTPNGMCTMQYCLANDSAHNMIGRLCRQLGHLSDMEYYTEPDTASATDRMLIWYAILNSGYSCPLWEEYITGKAHQNIQYNKPVLFSGGDVVSWKRHIWIVDGYKKMTVRYTTLHPDRPPFSRITYYNHINWGWNGRNNGYFLDNIFDTQNYQNLDSSPYSTVNINFTHEIRYCVPQPDI